MTIFDNFRKTVVSNMTVVSIAFLDMGCILYTGKIETGNKLESSVKEKLADPTVIACLKADCFMYYHAYADLVMLSKSTELDKSAFDMNAHYLELQNWLDEIQRNPSVIFNMQYRVFQSEEQLYGDNKKVNHRYHAKSKCLYDHLFAASTDGEDILLQSLVQGALKMKEKLCTYARNCLPGGRYWEPDPDEKKVLMQIKPSNDLCESILGLNDHLTTALPNLHQVSRSNLVSIKKNKAIEWLDNLTDKQQTSVIELAVESRKFVREEYKETEKELMKKRLQNIKQAHMRREVLSKKTELEKERLSSVHLVTSSDELHQALGEIDCQNITASKKKSLKVSFLKTQVNVRRKVLGQGIRIIFSKSGRQRALTDLISELADYIDDNPFEYSTFLKDPSSLVGKKISHKFVLPDDLQTVKWYDGVVLGYDPVDKLHTVLYDDEDGSESYFDLT